MGRSQFPLALSSGQPLGSRRWHPCSHRCLLKGCERWFLSHQPQARYCSPDCQKAARRWRCWHACQRYRATTNGKQHRRDQSRRYRNRAQQSLPLPAPLPPTPEVEPVTPVVDAEPPPYAQLKGSWSSLKNGKPLFHHVLQCVSCWKKELPDGDCRQGRRDYTKCPGTRSRGTWAGDRCYPTASKVHRRQLVADARPDSAQKTGCQGHRFPIHRCTVGPRRHFDGRRESLHASTRGVPSCGAGAHRAPGVGRVASNRRPAEQVHERSHRRQQYHRTVRRTGRPVPRLWRHLARGWPR